MFRVAGNCWSSVVHIARLAKLKLWLDEKQPKVAPDTLTRKAINYLINQWDHLVGYCEHGQLRVSNVLIENATRPFALGRRSWLFVIHRKVHTPVPACFSDRVS